ncbi:MAG: AraC family transcriptional regulator [Planctomycetota bacterium]
MELKNVGHLVPRADWMMKAHSHNDRHEMIIPLRGRMAVKWEGGSAIIGMGDAVVYPLGEWHEERADRKDPIESIFFGFAADMPSGIKVVPDRGHRIRTLAQYLLDTHQRRAPFALIAAFALAIVEEYRYLASTDEEDDLVSAARSFMLENITANIAVGDLARMARLSRFHFIRRYKAACGITPLADFRRLRVEEAGHLLTGTNLPLKAIAPMTGFANEYHFARVFKQIAGMTPARFRARG